MKISITLGLFCAVVGGAVASPAVESSALTVHEWGTFTTVSGSDGRLLPGLEREEHALPPFVHSHVGFSPANKGWNRPLANVTVKMETPVLYFYSRVPQTVDIDIQFQGGSISQWYPERTAGEVLPPAPEFVRSAQPASERQRAAIPPIDFARGYRGSATWRIDVLAPDDEAEDPVQQRWQTPALRTAFPSIDHWQRARVAGANRIRGARGGVEGFIFYRGVGNFELPLHIKVAGRTLELENRGGHDLPCLLLYEKSPEFPRGVMQRVGPLAPGARILATLREEGICYDSVVPQAERLLRRALEEAGLTTPEALALIATWSDSYLRRDGVRVFWIVPRAFTDRVLPISISPKPVELERVLVGRSEVLLPEFEQELVRDFQSDGGRRWANDRYFLAYRARVQQLGVVLPDARP